MSDAITCPACSEQFPYLPDLVGLHIRCPRCSHPFIVAQPVRRRARMPDLLPAALPRQVVTEMNSLRAAPTSRDSDPDDLPAFLPDDDDKEISTMTQLTPIPFGGTQSIPPRAVPPFPPHRSGPTLHALEAALLECEPPSELAPDPLPRALAMHQPPPLPTPLKIKPQPRVWNAAESATFQIGLTAICFGIFALLLPLSGARPFKLSATAPLLEALVILFGVITCAIVMFRPYLKWVFMGTCLMLMVMIFSLYRYAAHCQSAYGLSTRVGNDGRVTLVSASTVCESLSDQNGSA
jgi:DNA-directed RNA polymerase subunit RPC12/RpoP